MTLEQGFPAGRLRGLTLAVTGVVQLILAVVFVVAVGLAIGRFRRTRSKQPLIASNPEERDERELLRIHPAMRQLAELDVANPTLIEVDGLVVVAEIHDEKLFAAMKKDFGDDHSSLSASVNMCIAKHLLKEHGLSKELDVDDAADLIAARWRTAAANHPKAESLSVDIVDIDGPTVFLYCD